ncbi:PQQ-binding-like beta-propeller repeat protein [Paenibacillus sp. 1P07SE]|uniref:outer membrane protein assembly factor BamB family protein n=1 Tax=Paenibacillus sp. 1P07SE TaxID=3132209 RepID=UPI0039A4EA8C
MNGWRTGAAITMCTVMLGGVWQGAAPVGAIYAQEASEPGADAAYGVQREQIADLGDWSYMEITGVSLQGTLFYQGTRDGLRGAYGAAGNGISWTAEQRQGNYVVVGEGSQGVVYAYEYTDNGFEVFAYSPTGESRRIEHRPGMVNGHVRLLPDERLMVEYYTEKGRHEIRLIDRNGTLIWERTFKGLLNIQFAHGRFYVVDTEYGLLALDGQGSVVWRHSGRIETDMLLTPDTFSDTVYLQQPEPYATRVHALDGATGTARWERQMVAYNWLLEVEDGLQLVDKSSGDLYRFDRNGDYQWASLFYLGKPLTGIDYYTGVVMASDQGEVIYQPLDETGGPVAYRLDMETGRYLGESAVPQLTGSQGFSQFTPEGIYHWEQESGQLRVVGYDDTELTAADVPGWPIRTAPGVLYYADGGKLYRLSISGLAE